MSTQARELDPDALAALEEQRGFLRASLADLDRERDAGDLDADDHATLAADYQRRLVAVDRLIADGRAAFAAAKRRRSPLWYFAVAAAVLVFAVLAGVLVAVAAGRRDAGQQATGIDLRSAARQALAGCLAAEQAAPVSEVVSCYQSAIDEHRDDAGLLAGYGWFLARYGREQSTPELLTTGVNFIDRAAELAPARIDVRSWQVVSLYWAGRLDKAATALAALDALDPPAEVRSLIDTIRPDIETAVRG